MFLKCHFTRGNLHYTFQNVEDTILLETRDRTQTRPCAFRVKKTSILRLKRCLVHSERCKENTYIDEFVGKKYLLTQDLLRWNVYESECRFH